MPRFVKGDTGGMSASLRPRATTPGWTSLVREYRPAPRVAQHVAFRVAVGVRIDAAGAAGSGVSAAPRAQPDRRAR